MKISGAIFDVDGTLLDSMSIWDTIGADYLRSIGYIPRENLNEIFKNMSLLQAAEYYRNEYGVTLRVEEIMSGVNAMLEQFYQYEAPLKPGAAELLARLRQNRVKLCIATATDRYLVGPLWRGAACYPISERSSPVMGWDMEKTSRISLRRRFASWEQKSQRRLCLMTRSMPSKRRKKPGSLWRRSVTAMKRIRKKSAFCPMYT